MQISNETYKQIQDTIGAENACRKEPMKDHLTMKVGGPAEWFFTPGNEEELKFLIACLQKEQVPYYILGNGSNVICRDEGYPGAVICLLKNFKGFRILKEQEEEALVAVRAGTLNQDFSDSMIQAGLSGFEFASGIPGSIGGATAMNAGAYDGEIRQIVQEVRLLDTDGNIIVCSNEEMQFGYRHSLVSDRDLVVLETVFRLRKEDPRVIRKRVEELTEKRKEKQPLEYPSCGSTFKRPEGYFAGKLISDSGLKGFRLGGAQVSDKHAGFVINRDGATARDVLDLIAYVQQKVWECQGVRLECEVKIL